MSLIVPWLGNNHANAILGTNAKLQTVRFPLVREFGRIPRFAVVFSDGARDHHYLTRGASGSAIDQGEIWLWIAEPNKKLRDTTSLPMGRFYTPNAA